MFRRSMTLLVAVVLLVGLAVGAMYLPVPYLVASPGLALNTIGEVEGEQVIHVEGEESYEHDGELAMVTVQYSGGPGAHMDMFTVLSAWLSPNQAVLPEEALFPPDQSLEEINESQDLQMDDSQTAATAAALNELDIDYDIRSVVMGVGEDMPASGELAKGDVITEVDGEPVAGKDETVEQVSDREPGDPVELTVLRDGETEKFELTTTDDDGTALIGIMVGNDMEFPFDVEITVGEVGGPSAGMMFALGIMDRLTPEGLTGGETIAGSGTIEPDGTVGGVSGVEQKVVSAAEEGADYFLVAEDSCGQAMSSAASDEVDVVKVGELGDAVDALEDIRDGADPADLPSC
ncbi:PDZ domain-containing protein [Lipingzhangella halophila]|uniref:PDZ domain-containing protein n=1 Tax=Lipingzhangella halophila TaxID=1783352 RepID=A0A7W7W0H9_9ACTN|nr:PDZ domain-containing protein [Lipingzhangella halophila]MBB4929922.1 PDZ domain-containing protein [Lipingzhangella halophila]